MTGNASRSQQRADKLDAIYRYTAVLLLQRLEPLRCSLCSSPRGVPAWWQDVPPATDVTVSFEREARDELHEVLPHLYTACM